MGEWASWRPVTDLKASDFTVLEDKIPQTITTFSATTLVPEPPPPDASPVLIWPQAADRTSQPALGNRTAPQHRRVFLIVLGYGRIDLPTRAFDATIDFIRERLLPQDVVSVLAWDRATTTSPSRRPRHVFRPTRPTAAGPFRSTSRSM